MPYSYITLYQAQIQLAARLYDESNVFWSEEEKYRYIREALRCWNSLTSYWRTDFTFQSVASQTWYDLPEIANSPRPFTITDFDLAQIICNHILEPDTVPPWSGSLQFDFADILNAIQKRRDEVLSLTGCTIVQRNVAATPGRIELPDTAIDIRRVAWIPADDDFEPMPLAADDDWALQSFDTNFTTSGDDTPSSFRTSTEPPLSFEVDRQPPVPGTYDVLTVDAGVALSEDDPTILRVPDDFTWVIKWGALAELLGRESNAKDSMRAQYCEMRYRQGLAVLLNGSALLSARINNETMDVESVQSADDFRPGWQAEDEGQPDLMMVAGMNIVGMAPIPDDVYGITAIVVQNAPIPEGVNNNIQIGRDEIGAILDYAQHIASFKRGGAEFISTIPLLERFHALAMLYNSKLAEMGEFTHPAYELSQLQQQTNQTFTKDQDVASQ